MVRDLQQSRRSTDDMRRDIAALQAAHAPTLEAFHRLWYDAYYTHNMTYFEAVPLIKCPFDLWIYQELIFNLRPTLIIETGTAFGGSALFFARQLEKLGAGSVVSIDIEAAPVLPRHPRITFVPGSSTDPDIVAMVATRARSHERVMVILDSDHSAAHVTAELEAYAPLVTLGQFLVVEDTNINGHPVAIDWKGGPGPRAAVDGFLERYPEFEADILAERYLLTMHPGGWLKRVR
jgi:cephalosporin hydroxylase